MRRVITPKSELESYQNKKTTLASFKHFYDSRDENNNDKSLFLSLENGKKNMINNYKNITNGNIENKDNIIKQCKKNKMPQPEDEEEAIIISKRKYLDTLSNEDDDVICCSTGCNIF